VASQHKKLKQETDSRHPFFNLIIPNKRLKFRHSFLHFQPHSQRLSMWQEHLAGKPNTLAITPQESLPPGSSKMLPFWACFNRLRTAMGLCKANLGKWDYTNDGDISCLCGEEQTVAHLGGEQTVAHLGEEQTVAHLGGEQTVAHLGEEQTVAHLNSCPLLPTQCTKADPFCGLLFCLLLQDFARNTGAGAFQLEVAREEGIFKFPSILSIKPRSFKLASVKCS